MNSPYHTQSVVDVVKIVVHIMLKKSWVGSVEREVNFEEVYVPTP